MENRNGFFHQQDIPNSAPEKLMQQVQNVVDSSQREIKRGFSTDERTVLEAQADFFVQQSRKNSRVELSQTPQYFLDLGNLIIASTRLRAIRRQTQPLADEPRMYMDPYDSKYGR